MKEILAIVAVIVVLLLFMAHQNAEFSDRCRDRGGVPSIGRYTNTCYAPGVAIDLKTNE